VRAPVIVTRPAGPGQRLVEALDGRGRDVLWCPAFDITPPVDESLARRTLDRLAEYDLALFVSPNAVHATAERLKDRWPTGTVIGAVGSATREATAALPGAGSASTLAPDDGDESGSESFWRAWQASGCDARRVLVLRASTGRDWIIERFRAAGAVVDALPVYDRRPHVLGEPERRRLQEWMQAGREPVTIVSSTDAVASILEQVGGIEGAASWLKRGIAMATHPRVAQRLGSAGFSRVELCSADDSDVIGTLELIDG
jgi:uroporphyrinogen-III synthase